MRYHELLADPRRNKAFLRWFGDSVVVDGSGKPLPVFHGTYGNVHAFAHEHSNSRGGILAFFSTSPSFSSGYASAVSHASGGNVMPVYLRIERPFDYRQHWKAAYAFWRETGGITEWHDIWQINIGLHGSDDVPDTELSDSELSVDEFADAVRRGLYPALEAEEFVLWLRAEGFDGLVMTEGGGITYAIFEPNQAKSVFSSGYSRRSDDLTA